MKHLAAVALGSLVIAPLAAAPQGAPAAAKVADQNWPSFRGRFGRGVADGFAIPTEWNVENGTNVRWKTEIDGLAYSSPVIWGDKIFLTTATRDGEAQVKVGLYGSVGSVEGEGDYSFGVLCIDRTTGEELWHEQAWKGVPTFKRHPKGSHAASSCATDGERVAAFFGTAGLFMYDMKGEMLWKKDFGELNAAWYVNKKAEWGFASSPVIFENRVYVQCDVIGESFLAALDVTNGDEIWRTPRKEVPTWSTPTVHVGDGRRQLICNGYQHIGGYDLDTGKELWWLRGGGDIPVPTPVVAHGMIYITNAHGRAAPVLAISTKAEGKFTMAAEDNDNMVWSYPRRGGNYMQTPIVYGGYIYLCRDNGYLTCRDARTGVLQYGERIAAGIGFTASAVAADGKLFFPSETGEVHVIKAGPKLEKLAMNDMGEVTMASPALSRGTLYIRTRRHLVAIGSDG